jgi:hypothetical protein
MASRRHRIVGAMDISATTSPHPITASILAISAGRVGSIVASLLALAGIALGVRALARARRGRAADPLGGGAISLALGLASVAIGGVVVATSDPELGNGSGRGGAYVAIVLGLVATALGGAARARRPEPAPTPPVDRFPG